MEVIADEFEEFSDAGKHVVVVVLGRGKFHKAGGDVAVIVDFDVDGEGKDFHSAQYARMTQAMRSKIRVSPIMAYPFV